MNEEEKKAIRMQFQKILNKLVNNKIAPTGTAILAAEQPMILLFEELMNKIEKQQKELEKKDKIIDLMAERLEHDTEWFFSEFDDYKKQDFIDYFTKKADEING